MPPSPVDVLEDYPPGLFHEGYGLEIQGYPHHRQMDKQAMVFLPQGTKFRIRLCNANEYMAMASVFIDGISIGTFMMRPFSKCDLERPTDRPLQFTFMQAPPEPSDDPSSSKTQAKSPPIMRLLSQERTCISAVFKPEVFGKIIQFDVTAHSIIRTQRLEMLNETTVAELFEEIHRDFGSWILEATCALIHWTTVEYDSPVDDVLHSAVQTSLSALKRPQEPFRKMSLVQIPTLEILNRTSQDETTICLTLDALPKFGMILAELRPHVMSPDAIVYFQSDASRLLCSSEWIKDDCSLLDVLHKDEVLHKPLSISASCSKPQNAFTIIARMLNGPSYQLLVDSNTTIRECQYQLAIIVGAVGEGQKWLFGGALLLSGRTLGFYQISSQNVIDIIPKVVDTCPLNSLEMRDPIAVDGDKPVDTAELIRKEESKTKKNQKLAKEKQRKHQRKLHHRGTTLNGRTKQQYTEVDPIEVDEQFQVEMSVAILPKEHEDTILGAEPEEINQALHQQALSSKGCLIL